jgi:hypothetical protein
MKSFVILLAAAASALAAIPAHPGMLNYVEGQARIAGQTVTSSNVGAANVAEGQVIETGTGRAEILLTPGVFLRLSDNSAVRMDSDGLTNTRVAVLGGKVMVEADNLQKENDIQVQDAGMVARLEKNGIYQFAASPAVAATFDGKMQVTENDHSVDLGKGHQVTAQEPLQSQKFDVKASEKDPLYQWSKVRSEYLAEENVASARTLMVNGGGWYGGGWYWNPWFASYAWVPGDGMFWSPFGYGFYSPFAVWGAPVYGFRGGYFGGYRGFHRGSVYRAPLASHGFAGHGFAGHGFAGHGFAGGGRSFAGHGRR